MVSRQIAFQISLFTLCSFPLFVDLQLRAVTAIVFIVLQIILIALDFNKSSKGAWFLILQVAPVLLLIVSLLYSDNIDLGVKKLETNIMLLLIPIMLYLNRKRFTEITQQKTMMFFVAVSTFVSARVIVKMLASGKLFEVLQLNGGYYIIRTFLEQISGFHPTYFSLILAIALFALLDRMIQGFTRPIFWILSAISAVLLLVGLLLAMSKMILGSFFFITSMLVAKRLNSSKLKWVTVAFILLTATVFIAVKPIKDRGLEFVEAIFNSDVNQENPDSMRKGVYQATFDVIAEHPLFGAGIGDIQDELNKAYNKRGYTLAEERNFNTHNNYLNWWATAGLLPAVLFLLAQAAQLGIAVANKNYLHAAVVLLMSFSMLTENLLMRQDGVFTYAFFSTFFTYASWVKYRTKFVVNGKFIGQSLTGVQRFAREICANLTSNKSEYVIVSPSSDTKIGLEHIRVKPFSGTIWEQITLPLFMLFIGSRPLLNLCNSGPILYVNSYTVLHDVAFKENKSWFSTDFVNWYNFLIPNLLKRSKEVFTVSEFSKQEILKHFKLTENKVSVVYNGIPNFINTHDSKADEQFKRPYLLMVGSISKRKNQEYVVRCFTKWPNAPYQLIIAGSKQQVLSNGHIITNEVRNSQNITIVSNPSDEELSALYKSASGCIYTPYYEGFGIPVVEAIASNNNIIVSDIPVFRELFEGYVTFARLDDDEHLKQVIIQFFDQEKPNQLNSLANISELRQKYCYQKSANEIHAKIVKDNQ